MKTIACGLFRQISFFFFFYKWVLIFKLCTHQPHTMSTAFHWAKFKSGGNLIQKRPFKKMHFCLNFWVKKLFAFKHEFECY